MVPCRYHDNRDNTVTDFDTGLMWLKLVGLDGVQQPNVLDAHDRFDWSTALQMAASINGASTDGRTLIPLPGNASHGDWRLPTIVELATILDTSAPDCAIGGACIDPIFGPTVAGSYWSTTADASPKWIETFSRFGLGFEILDNPGDQEHMRVVRSAL